MLKRSSKVPPWAGATPRASARRGARSAAAWSGEAKFNTTVRDRPAAIDSVSPWVSATPPTSLMR